MKRLMTRSQFAIGSATFAVVIIAGVVSFRAVDRTFALIEAGHATAEAPPIPDANTASQPSVTSGPCVDKDGSWKNWPHPNVPMLSPKCAD